MAEEKYEPVKPKGKQQQQGNPQFFRPKVEAGEKIYVIIAPMKNKNNSVNVVAERNNNVEFDRKFLAGKNQNQYKVLIPDEKTTLADIFNDLSKEDSKTEIVICISAHASPGKSAKIGYGTDDNRISLTELLEYVKANGIEKLKSHNLHFLFHCCNSAYAPTDVKPLNFSGQLTDEQLNLVAEDVLQRSAIGVFYKKIKDELPELTVKLTGFRGYVVPGKDGMKLAAIYGKIKANYSIVV